MSLDGQSGLVPMPDMQNTSDKRGVAIDRVGVSNVRYPIQVLDRANEFQRTAGTFALSVNLSQDLKGTHMSRFLEALNAHEGEISVNSIPALLTDLRTRLHSESAQIDVDFNLFISKAAPVSGKSGMMEYSCRFEASQGSESQDFIMQVVIPIATLCPCSKEISAYGAHNQRGYVTIRIRPNAMIWIEELIEQVEACGSAPLYPVLKRTDEKFVTEQAYDSPRFVEDVIREVALVLNNESRVTWYSIKVENHESIHAHNAIAMLERTK